MPEDPYFIPPAETRGSGSELAPGSGLPRHQAAGLASLFSLPGGVIFFWLDRRDPFVRYYAVQAMVLGTVLALASMLYRMADFVFGAVPWLGVLIMLVVKLIWTGFTLLWLAAWLITTICAFWGRRWSLPYVGAIIQRLSAPAAPPR